ncbi:MAG: hypothetical protein LBV76_02775 [Deltaproteobacteria bacterium]|jgi:hypothetical protein|nr:hypothetical protein [Deltaproteobacteria bacterium]
MRYLVTIINAVFCFGAAALGLWCLALGVSGVFILFVLLPVVLAAGVCWRVVRAQIVLSGAGRVFFFIFSLLLIAGAWFGVTNFGTEAYWALLVPGISNILYFFELPQKILHNLSVSPFGVAYQFRIRHAIIAMNLLLCAFTLYTVIEYLYTFSEEMLSILIFGLKGALICLSLVAGPIAAGLCAFSAYSGRLYTKAHGFAQVMLALSVSIICITFSVGFTTLLLYGPWLINVVYFFHKKNAESLP